MTSVPLPMRRLARLPVDTLRGATTAATHALRRARARIAEEHGISIIELLVTMVIMTVIITALTSVIVEASKAQVRTSRTTQAQDQGRLALDKLRRELHCANSVSVVNASGTAVNAGTVGNQIRITLGGYCPSNGLTTNAATTVYVTWCTAASTKKTGDYALWRRASTSSQPACAATGRKWADYLTTAVPFCLPSTTAACGGVLKTALSLPTVRVTLPVNLNGPTSTTQAFRLVDDIALRNSVRV